MCHLTFLFKFSEGTRALLLYILITAIDEAQVVVAPECHRKEPDSHAEAAAKNQAADS